MNHLLQKTAFALGAVALCGAITACEGEYGDTCTFPEAQQLRICGDGSEDSTTSGTCVDRNAPDCDSKMCASHGEGKPFCTIDCESDDDCETGSSCVSVVAGANNICVPDERN